jgi:F-type H+-transporting ATPase subunit b
MIRRVFLTAILAGSITLFAQETEHAQHAEEAKGEMEVPSSLKWANFALLALGLGYMLAKLLPKTFAERTASIQKDIKEAQALKADAEKRAAQVEARVASLGADIEKFRTEAAKDMAAEGERIRQETAAHIQRMEAQAGVEIESAGKIARRDLSRYSAELALKLAEDRVRARLDNASESGLVDNFVAELSRQGSKN